ncbi:hypothetical protein [Streptomyces sp. NPDC026589]|uniref:hypothetical protein n=1 Tax=Streptomyces sp. NPDC026589 TaxID=3155609 RepID=UPI0033C88266
MAHVRIQEWSACSAIGTMVHAFAGGYLYHATDTHAVIHEPRRTTADVDASATPG